MYFVRLLPNSHADAELFIAALETNEIPVAHEKPLPIPSCNGGEPRFVYHVEPDGLTDEGIDDLAKVLAPTDEPSAIAAYKRIICERGLCIPAEGCELV
jgi:hypothetical protein